MDAARVVKSGARRLLDRAVAPYVEESDREIRELRTEVQALRSTIVDQQEPDAPTDRTSDTFHQVLHELRTSLLRRSAGSYGTILSVGASGRWYFDWVEQSIGPVESHIGVEAFEPEPPDLPAYARWIDSTADRFPTVGDDSVDLVFAGQTTEHLWPDELAGFLLESNRVLREGGTIVVDSPNRLVTEHLDWSHGGHTLEISADEISELLRLAGFEVDEVHGAWLCRIDGTVHELEDGIDHAGMVTRRIADGLDEVDGSFVWWVTGRRVAEPQVDALRRRVDELFDRHWSTRVCRGMWGGPGSEGPAVPAGGATTVRSLPMFLRPGTWSVGVELSEGSWDAVDDLGLVIASPGDHVLHRFSADDFGREGDRMVVRFDHADLVLALTLELHLAATDAVRVAMPLHVAPSGTNGATSWGTPAT